MEQTEYNVWKIIAMSFIALVILGAIGWGIKAELDYRNTCKSNVATLTNVSNRLYAEGTAAVKNNDIYVDVINTCKTDAFITCAQGVLTKYQTNTTK